MIIFLIGNISTKTPRGNDTTIGILPYKGDLLPAAYLDELKLQREKTQYI